VDADELLRNYADDIGVTPKANRPESDVDKVRQARAQQMAEQAQAEQAQQMGNVAAALGSIPSDTNVLNDMGLV
jgi:hypothetical protein